MRGDGRFYLRGTTWWIAYMAPSADGLMREKRESSGSESQVVAEKMLRARVREVANHRSGIRAFTGPEMGKLTMGDLLDSLTEDYRQRRIKSLERSLSHMRPLREHFGDTRAISVTSEHVRRYRAMRAEKKLSDATINRETQILASAFRLAMKEDRINRMPHCGHLTEGPARKGFFEAEQHAQMLKHLRPPMDDMARFAYVCGWRRSEVALLRWEHVDRAAREVRLPDTKNGDPRTFPLDQELGLWNLFESLWEKRAYVHHGAHGISEYAFHVHGRPISDTKFSRLWKEARAAAGPSVSGRIFHDYRRTAVRNLVRAGVPENVAMRITGHRSNSVFRRYDITSTADRREALRKLGDYLGGGTVEEFRRKE